LQDLKVPRPLTHDLLKNALDYLECRVKRVEVCDIREGTYYGRLVLEIGADEAEIDCRPSDAIALALRVSCPIFVHEKVMDEAGRGMETLRVDEEMPKAEPREGGQPPKEKPRSPVEILNAKLEKAIVDERYEDAARLRDEIKRLKKHTDN
ncbi:MAG: DUF151 domain-containing protein, partial [Verrucomicrobia bacterium]|nr:DUF151 domain-containing protein [Verrucomicrobiota bacterium]